MASEEVDFWRDWGGPRPAAGGLWARDGMEAPQEILASLPVHLRHAVKTEIVTTALAGSPREGDLSRARIEAVWKAVREALVVSV